MEPTEKQPLDQVRDAIRLKHCSIHTEEAHITWIKRCICFHDVCHPAEMDAPEVQAFLTHLAVKGNVAASTQDQALGALLFLYREVLHQDLDICSVNRGKVYGGAGCQEAPVALVLHSAQSNWPNCVQRQLELPIDDN